jgi:hypothetical protein
LANPYSSQSTIPTRTRQGSPLAAETPGRPKVGVLALVLAIIVGIIAFLNANSSGQDSSGSFDDDVPAAEALIDPTLEESPWDSADFRAMSTPEYISLPDGEYISGVDFPAGRYTLSLEQGSSADYAFVSLIPPGQGARVDADLLLPDERNDGLQSFTTALADGVGVFIAADSEVQFTPAQTVGSGGFLTPGAWLVGVDVEPGSYRVEAEGYQMASVEIALADAVLTPQEAPLYLEPGLHDGRDSGEIALREGEIVLVGYSQVTLTPLFME